MGRTSARKQKEAARRRAEELLAEQAAVGTDRLCTARSRPPKSRMVDWWISLRLRGAVQKSNATVRNAPADCARRIFLVES